MTRHRKRFLRPWITDLPYAGVSGLVLSCAMGCSSLNAQSWPNPFRPSDASASIDNVQGPLERNLNGVDRQASLADSQGFQDYEVARELYDQGKYSEAEKAFKTISDEHAVDDSGFFRKRKLKNIFSTRKELEANYYDNPLVEDSLFMLAESRYAQEKLPGAEDIYLQLLKQYPNTRHMDVCTKRLFDIAHTWMDFKTTTSEDVQVASYSDNGPSAKPEVVKNKDYERPGFFNFGDRRRPVTDTEGRALEALKAIWLNDPTGPLADDALMLTASHYLRVGRYAEASETFKILREEFPDSPHLKDAYLLGAHVTQASYQGAEYDDRNLEESKQLKSMAMSIFPNLTAEEKARLEAEMVKMDDATVARELERALFWLHKGRFDAVEMCCHQIINKYPASKYAGKARGLLKKLPEYREQNTLVLAAQGITIDSLESVEERTAPSMMMPEEKKPAPAEQSPAEAPAERPRYLPLMEMPKMKPIPIPKLWPEKTPEPEPESAPPFNNAPQEQPGQVNLTLGQE